MPRKFSGETLVLATHNKSKIIEMRDLFAGYAAHIATAADLSLPEPAETGTTFLENATIKALAAARASKMPALADDSGLSVDALGGAPGVYSADWAGPSRDFTKAMSRVLEEMRGKADRTASFKTALVLAWPDGHVEVAEGRVDGHISPAIQGERGFGYDPLFIPVGDTRTFAEMSLSDKQKISHRTRAVQVMLEKCFK